MNFLSKLFLFFGLVFFLFGLAFLWERQSPNRLSFTNPPPNENKVSLKKHIPSVVEIPSIHVKLNVFKAEVTHNTWETTTEGISYLSSSAVPGERGNSILYGHNWTSILGNLVSVKPGDSVIISFNDNTRKIFLIKTTATVDPTMVSVLKATSDKRITLYTCTGFFDTKRFVVVAIES